MGNVFTPELEEAPASESGVFRFLTVNDVYEPEPVGKYGGMASFHTLLQQHRTKNSFAVLNGDFLGGSSIAEKFRGENVIETLNHIKFDAVVLGNHEFDYGPDVLKQRIDQSNFQWFGSNVIDKHTDSIFDGVTDVHVLTMVDDESKEEIRIGIFGVCTEKTPKLSWPGPTIGFSSYLSVAKECVAKLRKLNVDVIVGLTHVSLAEDLEMARAIPEIDLLLGGHDHTPFAEFEGETLVFKCGQNARWLGVVDLKVQVKYDEAGTRQVDIIPSWSMVANHGFEQDQGCKNIIQKYKRLKEEQESHEDNNEVVTTVIEEDLSTKTDITRRSESTFGTIIADAMASHYASDLAIINGGFIRGDRVYPVGSEITTGTIKTELPFPKNALKLGMLGKHVLLALEQMLSTAPVLAGHYPHVSSRVKIVYSDKEPKLSRVKSLLLNDEDLKMDEMYSVVTSEFLARGGDGISAFEESKLIEDHKILISTLTMDFMRNIYGESGVSGALPKRVVNC